MFAAVYAFYRYVKAPSAARLAGVGPGREAQRNPRVSDVLGVGALRAPAAPAASGTTRSPIAASQGPQPTTCPRFAGGECYFSGHPLGLLRVPVPSAQLRAGAESAAGAVRARLVTAERGAVANDSGEVAAVARLVSLWVGRRAHHVGLLLQLPPGTGISARHVVLFPDGVRHQVDLEFPDAAGSDARGARSSFSPFRRRFTWLWPWAPA
jgi:hypothetical protein